jgi:hypothetical protein
MPLWPCHALPWYYHFEARWLTEGLEFLHRAVALGAFSLRAYTVPFSLMRLPFKVCVCTSLLVGRMEKELSRAATRATAGSASTTGTPPARAKEAHRVRVQTRVRCQRRGFGSPIWARTLESESK